MNEYTDLQRNKDKEVISALKALSLLTFSEIKSFRNLLTETHPEETGKSISGDFDE